jgi:hypothetical protein
MYSHFSRDPCFSRLVVSSFWEHAKPEILMFVILHPYVRDSSSTNTENLPVFHSHMRQETLWVTGWHEVIHHVQI